MKICESIYPETFHAVYYFLLFLAWVKQILPIFHFTMLAGLLCCWLSNKSNKKNMQCKALITLGIWWVAR